MLGDWIAPERRLAIKTARRICRGSDVYLATWLDQRHKAAKMEAAPQVNAKYSAKAKDGLQDPIKIEQGNTADGIGGGSNTVGLMDASVDTSSKTPKRPAPSITPETQPPHPKRVRKLKTERPVITSSEAIELVEEREASQSHTHKEENSSIDIKNQWRRLLP